MDIKNIIKKIILEDIAKSASVQGSDAETALTRAEYLKDKAMQNLSDLGVYSAKGHMAALGIFDQDYLSKSGPFDFSFTTKSGKLNKGKAEYDKTLSNKEKTIVLSFKSEEPVCFEGNCYQFFKIKFSPQSIHRAYMQTVKRKLPKFWKKIEKNVGLKGLQEGYVFDVVIIPYGKSQKSGKLLKKQRYGRSFKKGLAGQQTQMKLGGQAPGQSGQQSLQFPESYSNPNSLLFEEAGEIIQTQIKINKIGLDKPSGDENEDYEFSSNNFIKVEGGIELPQTVGTLFNDITIKKIKTYLQKGIFYVKLSEKNKNDIVLSDTPKYDTTSEYLVLRSEKNIDTSNPKSWRDVKVSVGKKALRDYEFPPNITGTIRYLKIIE